jgi:outer membrane protein assembly factor BamB
MKKNYGEEILSVDIYKRGWISIGGTSFSFSGQCSKSENNIYILAWNDAHMREDENTGKKEFIDGQFLLLENQKLILRGALRRPNDGQVANNGTFIFNDWIGFSGGEDGKGLEGNFLVFNKKGEEIINHHYSANLGKNSLSNDGRYAVCQTYHSNTTDGNTVTCFDLLTGKLLWQKIPETKNANAFEIDSEEKIIYFLYNSIGKFRYTLAGEFLDKDKWYQARLKHGTGYELIEIANQKLATMGNSANPRVANEVLNLYLLAIEKIDSEYFLAQVHRKVGEIYELMNKVDKAVFHYELAQKHNPKVGVIKKLQKLKPEKQKQEKQLPFSINLFKEASVQLIKIGKSVQAGIAPRGTYFQVDHYNDACWYIKNNYISGLEKGSAKISITNKYGELINSVDLDHLVFKAKRASNSNYFVVISYDLKLYLYSPTLNLISSKKLLKKLDDRYRLKEVDISPTGDLVVVAIDNGLILYDKELKEIKDIATLTEKNTKSYHTENFVLEIEYDGRDNISALQINDIDDMYFGTYSGKVFKFTKDGSQEPVYKCRSPIRDIKRINHHLVVTCDKYIDIVKNGKRINTIEETGKVIWGDNAGCIVTKKVVKLFTLIGLPIAELTFTDSVAGAYLFRNNLIVFTSKKSFVFGYSKP